METKFILIGFQNNPLSKPKILKKFSNGKFNILQTAIGCTSTELKIKYSEGLENALIFNSKNEASLIQQILNRSFHSRYNSWCVRELEKESTIKNYMIDFLQKNSHIHNFKNALEILK